LLFAGFARRRIGVPLLFIDDRLGEHAPEGKWAGWVLDDACELDGAWSGRGQRNRFLGKRKGLAAPASANPLEFLVAGARNHECYTVPDIFWIDLIP
jgi:hypothetical protein